MVNAQLKGTKLVIEIDADPKATQPSASGKSRKVASTNGNVTTALMVAGKPLVIGLNAYIKSN